MQIEGRSTVSGSTPCLPYTGTPGLLTHVPAVRTGQIRRPARRESHPRFPKRSTPKESTVDAGTSAARRGRGAVCTSIASCSPPPTPQRTKIPPPVSFLQALPHVPAATFRKRRGNCGFNTPRKHKRHVEWFYTTLAENKRLFRTCFTAQAPRVAKKCA